ncbi:uncharacterized protein BO80DRAFT_67005 [Aspergillus ibericus CBS 121593]|uniref:Secreted protein n=1 Tax=Aspergillus ibericus CBS 121593 TaxID=1448316 RepID=A0A395H163_9EURO|nr:hypothetical protein BO80DRAFT_67005 [Aspergillus ibericus CBS 121593]RAL01373.1 hypothetical protein BO80DRAFT_67005 [Aspergillus ibericus CBS 121593]
MILMIGYQRLIWLCFVWLGRSRVMSGSIRDVARLLLHRLRERKCLTGRFRIIEGGAHKGEGKSILGKGVSSQSRKRKERDRNRKIKTDWKGND